MVYITQYRASSDELNHLTREKSQAIDAFIPLQPSEVGGQITNIFNGVPQAPYPVYTWGTGSAYGALGGVVGRQDTYSWRTGKVLEDNGGDEVLTGKDMYQAILSGYDIDITHNPRRSDIIDRNVSAFAYGRSLDSYDNGHDFWTKGSRYLSNIDCNLGRNRVNWRLTKVVNANWTQVLDWWAYPPTLANQTPPFNIAHDPPALATRLANGSKLVNLAAPNRPYVDTTRAIGEIIKDGFPAMMALSLFRSTQKGLKNILKDGKGSFSGTRSALAGEYLNFQFGILPTYNDAKDILQAVIKSDEILSAYNESSGEFTTRKRSFPEDRETKVVEVNKPALFWPYRGASPDGSDASLLSFLDTSNTKVTWLSQKKTNTYFSGAFTYAVPTGDDVVSRFRFYADQARKLLGVDLTVSTVYDLTPFSWLLDWVVDFGTVFNNAVLFNTNNLVMKYGYVMHNMSHDVNANLTGLKDASGKPLPSVNPVYRNYFYKTRDRATPFGFALDTGKFTNYQWSILAALGLSRGRNIRLNESL